ncbi:MAG: alpha/beta hydrolase [Chloroflexi bacterium]|nr:MAG: alpha/beta hydrolase [Chloroflexota bacterium]
MASPELKTITEMLRARQQEAPSDISFPASRAMAGGIPAEWIAASRAGDDQTIYWLHGGGYCIGSINTHRGMLARISAATRARVFAIDYRLAPEDPFPAAVEDAVSGYLWLLASGVDPEQIIIGGDSAGGGLAVATVVALKEDGKPLPAAAVCISPWTDMALTGDSLRSKAETDPMITNDGITRVRDAYVGDSDPSAPLVSPIYAGLSGLPPLLIQVGENEVLLNDSTRLAERAEAAGVDVTLEVWPEMIHVWHFFAAMLPEGQKAIDRIGEWVRQRLGAPVTAS